MPPVDWIILIAIAFIGLVLPVAGIWPPILRGSSVSNNILFVTMAYRNGQPEEGLTAQEVCEFWLRILVAIPISAIVLLLAGSIPWMFVPVVVAIAGMWTIITPLMRQLEYIGHAAEVLEANRALERPRTNDIYLMEEASRVQRAYSGAFEHLTVDEVAEKIRSRFGIGHFLIALLHRRWR